MDFMGWEKVSSCFNYFKYNFKGASSGLGTNTTLKEKREEKGVECECHQRVKVRLNLTTVDRRPDFHS